MGKNIRETSAVSYKEIKKTLSARHYICLDALMDIGEATANQVAMHVYDKGVTPYFNRNFVHPRLNELVEMGKVEIVGTKIDTLTNRRCMIYRSVTNEDSRDTIRK